MQGSLLCTIVNSGARKTRHSPGYININGTIAPLSVGQSII